MSGHTRPSIPDPPFDVAEGHQGSPTGISEENHGFGSPSLHFIENGLDIDGALFMQTISVVVHVAGTESQNGITGGRQQWTGIVNAEIPPRVRQDHRSFPGTAVRWSPQDSPDQGPVGAN
jgi:hypothetical protein